MSHRRRFGRGSLALALPVLLLVQCRGPGGQGTIPTPSAPEKRPSSLQGPTLDPQDLGTLPFMDPDLSLEVRVEDLLGRMTLEEKVSQTLYTAPAIPRLGIPEYNWWNEALHGVARAGIATVFPQAIGLAATWDTDLLNRVAGAISDEARAKHHEWVRRGRRGIYEGLTFWSPNINIFRDPRWGRGMETYGEDPYLAGQLAVSFVRGMQGDHPFYLKTVATPKHYAVHSGPEPDRHTFDAAVSEADLRETYLPAFRAAVVDGGAESVMCAYNRFRGDPACGSPELLQKILREEWGFDGYVVSDCWAISDIYSTHKVVETPVEAAAMGMASGTDLNCGVTYRHLGEAVRSGLLPEEALDRAVRRLLRTRFRLGIFDPPERVPWSGTPYEVNDSPEHRALALEAARKSLVLLKNEGGLLPLRKTLGTIAVIGPNADDVEVLLGNYNGFPSDPVTPLRGIREAVSSHSRVIYARGAELGQNLSHLETIPSSVLATPAGLEGGLRGEYFPNLEMEGEVLEVRTDEGVNARWWGEPPLPGLAPGDFSVRWTGSLTPPVTGRYSIGAKGLGSYELFLDDSLVGAFSSEHEINTRWTDLHLEADTPLDLRLDFRPRRADAAIELVWAPPRSGMEEEALSAIGEADVVILVLGLSPRLEGEEMRVEVPGFGGGDRIEIGLPDTQQRLMEIVAATGKPAVLVLMNGSALAVPWAGENIPSIVEAWYPGQAAGTALAEVLFGDYNPSGRLPLTFYRSVEELPPFHDYDMEGRTYRYFRGEPLFPFGHGLSYTTFSYGPLVAPPTVTSGDTVHISVDVTNTGDRFGEEVVQLYVTDLEASVPVPLRSLKGIQRVRLAPGETERIHFELGSGELSIVTDQGERVLEPGVFEVSVGGKQPGFRGVADAPTTEVVIGTFRVIQGPGGSSIP